VLHYKILWLFNFILERPVLLFYCLAVITVHFIVPQTNFIKHSIIQFKMFLLKFRIHTVYTSNCEVVNGERILFLWFCIKAVQTKKKKRTDKLFS